MRSGFGLLSLTCLIGLVVLGACADGGGGGGGGGVTTPQGLTITPSPIDFGSVSISTSNTLTVTVTNNSATSIDITSVAIVNDTNSVFSLVGAPTVTTAVASGANIQFDVQFDPGATAQTSTAQLEVQNSGPTATVSANITGTGTTAPAIQIAPTPGTPDALGTQSIGGTPLSKTFTITNNGTADLIITEISIAGTDYSLTAGAVTSPATVTVTPGAGSHQFTVQFNDTGGVATTNVVGNVLINHNAPGASTTINFTADVAVGPTYPPFLPLQPTSGMTLQTTVSQGTDDDGQFDIDISTCPFPFNSTTYDRMSVSTNGYIRFGSGSFPSATAFSDADTFIEQSYAAGNAQISFLAEDCTLDAGTSEFYSTIDTANQRVVFRLENYRDLGTSTNAYNSIQVVLYCSGGGNIQISYYNSTFNNNDTTWSIGVSEPATTTTVSNFDFVGATLQQINTGFNLGCIAQDPKHATVAGWTALDGRSILFFRTSTASPFETVVDTTP